jgi:hypothetical protein
VAGKQAKSGEEEFLSYNSANMSYIVVRGCRRRERERVERERERRERGGG